MNYEEDHITKKMSPNRFEQKCGFFYYLPFHKIWLAIWMKDEEGWANSLTSLPNEVILWTDTNTASGILTVALVRSALGVWNWTVLPPQKICSLLKFNELGLATFHYKMNTSATQLQVDIKRHFQIIMTKIMSLAPRVTRLYNIIMSPNMVISRGFIKHRKLENSPSTMHNSPAKFQWSMAIFCSDESDADM